MKNSKFYLLSITFTLFLGYISLLYILYIEERRENYQESIYLAEANKMKKGVLELIETKEKATVAIALSLAKDSSLGEYLYKGNIPPYYYKKIIKAYKDSTHYKNIWIQILDKDLNSLYRSWTSEKNDSLLKFRKDLESALESKEALVGISSSRYDLSLSAMVPIHKDGELLGLLEVTSHFNSIAEQMQHFDISSIVLLDINNSKRLKEPFTNIFLDNYYVANFNAPKRMLKYMKERDILQYIDSNSSYCVENGYLISSLKLQCLNNKEIGDYILLKKLSDISSTGVEFLFFRELAFGLVSLLFIIVITTFVMFYYIRKQKLYYKNIIDTSTDIILVNNRKKIVDVNDTFLKYFKNYKDLEEFQEDYKCICDLFEEQEDYLQERMDNLHWIDYLLQEESKSSVVKMSIDKSPYYFKVSASRIMNKAHIYSIVFSDITEQENYKRSLEVLTTTDPLTEIGNRRYYEQKLSEEVLRARRYNHNLSLIMFDIDFFKKVNDTYGHDVGDMVLKEYSHLIKSLIRNEDIFCRIGGEEFMLILPETNLEASHIIVEKLRQAVESFECEVQVTMSFGLVQYIASETEQELYSRVDKALYKAKHSGRNRVVVG